MRSAPIKSAVNTCKPVGIAAPLKILSWSLDRSESTTFAKAPATYPPHVYFGGAKERGPPPGATSLLRTLSGETLSEIRNSDDFVRFFSSDKGWRETLPDSKATSPVVSVGAVRSFLNPNQRARRIAKERRLEEICRFLTTAAADVLCLQDCDDEAIKAIESLRFTLPRSDTETTPTAVYRYRFVSAVEITSTGVTCSFIREADNGLGVDVATPKWALDTVHVGMPFVTFSIKPTAASSVDGGSNGSLTVSNVDLTHVVRELATEHSSQHNKKHTPPSGTGGGGSGDLNRDFNYVLRGSLPKAATYAWKATKDGKMPSDSLQIQREAALALLARGGQRLYVPSATDKEAEDLSGNLPPIAPDIMIGNTHLRHGWTQDRMRHVLPDYVDAWELAGRKDANWETYAFYRKSSPEASSGSTASHTQPTNARYFLDSEEDSGLGVGDEYGQEEDSPASAQPASKSRAKGGRYSRCMLRKALLPPSADIDSLGQSRVQYDCPRPMIEENCSCSDQFPILVTIE